MHCHFIHIQISEQARIPSLSISKIKKSKNLWVLDGPIRQLWVFLTEVFLDVELLLVILLLSSGRWWCKTCPRRDGRDVIRVLQRLVS